MGEPMRESKRSLMNSVRRFWSKDEGSITIQVLTFSMLLLATTGIVLDSGRLYTQHSQMQAYTDQMSLAAANELDGNSDALERASNAVFGTDPNGDPFLRKAGVEQSEFRVRAIFFYDSMAPSGKTQNDMTEAFPDTALVGIKVDGQDVTYAGGYDATTGPQAARYAVVQATERATKSALVGLTASILRMGNTDDGEKVLNPRPDFQPDYSFGTVAAASNEQRYCADLNNLVFCNPWEDTVPDPTTNAFEQAPFDVDPSSSNYTLVGRSLMFFAPNFKSPIGQEDPLGGIPVSNGQVQYESAYEWDTPHQLFKLTAPIVDEGAICDASNVPVLQTGEDYVVSRDRCMMARAETDQVCWGEGVDLTIQPAHGPDVARAVNTAFDIWLPPFDTYLQNSTSATVGNTGLTPHEFFEPDALATTIYELADWYGQNNLGLPEPGSMQDNNPADEFAAPVNGFDAYAAHIIPAPNMRYTGANFVSSYGKDVCHNNSYAVNVAGVTSQAFIDAACAEDFIGNHYEGNSSTELVARSDMLSYWRDMYQLDADFAATLPPVEFPPGSRRFRPATSFCGVQFYEDTIPGLAEACAALNPGPVDTWYKVYQKEREGLTNLALETRAEQSLVTRNVSEDPNNPGVAFIEDPTAPITGGQWSDGDIDDDGVVDSVDYVTRYGLDHPADDFVKHRPMDYFGMSPASTLFSPERERRRIRSAMVNCVATTSVGGTGANSNEYEVNFEDVRVLDMYIPQPAGFHCGFGPDIDGDGNPDPLPTCAIEDSKDTLLYAEIIEDVTEEATTQQFVAKLVR